MMEQEVVTMRSLYPICGLALILFSANAWPDGEGLTYHSYYAAVLSIKDQIRNPRDFRNGFRYVFHIGWGGKADVIFEIHPYYPYRHKHGYEAVLYKYKRLLFYQIADLYHKGYKTDQAILSRLKRTEYEANSDQCPKLEFYLHSLFENMKSRASNISQNKKDVIYIDSPDVFHYYYVSGSIDMLQLNLTADEGPLYQETHEAMSYLEHCGTKTENGNKTPN
ncbi:MAG: hypothetical protein ACRETC_00125 [Gammaproteobacteria bacterium]